MGPLGLEIAVNVGNRAGINETRNKMNVGIAQLQKLARDGAVSNQQAPVVNCMEFLGIVAAVLHIQY